MGSIRQVLAHIRSWTVSEAEPYCHHTQAHWRSRSHATRGLVCTSLSSKSFLPFLCSHRVALFLAGICFVDFHFQIAEFDYQAREGCWSSKIFPSLNRVLNETKHTFKPGWRNFRIKFHNIILVEAALSVSSSRISISLCCIQAHVTTSTVCKGSSCMELSSCFVF